MDEEADKVDQAKAQAIRDLDLLRDAVYQMHTLKSTGRPIALERVRTILGESLFNSCRCNRCANFIGIEGAHNQGNGQPICLVALFHVLYDNVCARIGELTESRMPCPHTLTRGPRDVDKARRTSPIWKFSNDELAEAMRAYHGNLRTVCEQLGIPSTSHSTLWARVRRNDELRKVYDDCRARWTRTGHAKYPEADTLPGA